MKVLVKVAFLALAVIASAHAQAPNGGHVYADDEVIPCGDVQKLDLAKGRTGYCFNVRRRLDNWVALGNGHYTFNHMVAPPDAIRSLCPKCLIDPQ